MTGRFGGAAAVRAFLLLFVVAEVSSGDVLVAKCCPPGEQLHNQLNGCVPYKGARNDTDVSDAEETAGALRARYADAPWWIDPHVSKTLLGPESENSTVLYNGLPGCDKLDTFVLQTTQRAQYAVFANGSLQLPLTSSEVDAAGRRVTLDPGSDFCMDRVDVPKRPVFVFLTCPCTKVLCVNKCCKYGKMEAWTDNKVGLRKVSTQCVNTNNKTKSWSPTFYDGRAGNKTSREVVYLLIAGKAPQCPANRGVMLNSEERDPALRFWLTSDGDAHAENFGGDAAYTRGNFCADWLQLSDGRIVDNVYFCGHSNTTPPSMMKRVYYGALYGVAAAFLLLTVLLYMLLPELRVTPHAKAVVCHAAALFVAFVFSLHGQVEYLQSWNVCYSSAFIVQFSFLSAFFWLNVMCIDISWAFSGLRAPAGSIADRDRRKFLFYSLYAWGCPAVITAVTALLQFVEDLPTAVIRPDIGVKNCWFLTKNATLLYFYGPMALLLAANLALFVFTALRIFWVQRDNADVLDREGSRRHGGGAGASTAFADNRKRLILYVKLFCLMGLTWITEIISWAEGSDAVFWYVTDFINLLRGVFIFIIFCWKPKVWRLLKRRLHEWRAKVLGRDGLRRRSSAPGGGFQTTGRATSLTLEPNKTSISSGSTHSTSLRLGELTNTRRVSDT